MRRGEVSFWYQALGGIPTRRAALAGDTAVDVCIIGAGYTGLWTAYALSKLAPELDILIVEKNFAGYGASGRNGGWLTGGFEWNAKRYGPGTVQLAAQLRASVDAVITAADAEGIDADIHRTEELTLACSEAEDARMVADIAGRRGIGEPVSRLSADDVRARIDVPDVRGAMRMPGVAHLQPAKLVRGLAAAVERRGVRLVEGTEVTAYGPGRVETPHGRIAAGAVIRATEGYTADLAQAHRDWLPLNSAQIVTAPLSDRAWQLIGWRGAELIGDYRHVYCYCQRTADGRIAVGSRGVPYRYGSRTDTDGAPDAISIQRLKAVLARLFPVAAAEARLDHAWCGVVAVPRDWCATVGFDPETRIGWAGGYVGVGVATSNLAGRTLADLVLGRDSDLTALPWVNRRVRRWEPEPLRWLALRGMYGLMHAADGAEARGGGTRSWAKLGSWLTGR